LRAGICGLIAAAALGPTTATGQEKASQEEALYQGGPKNGLSCAVCTLFRPPHACVIVAGDISAQGWCRFFDMAD
jgi:CO dehydrogenase/acetyl-CoA synthase beta subunit